MTTTLPKKVMTKLADTMELKLKENNVEYLRQDTEFSVEPFNIEKLLQIQLEVTTELIVKGVITEEMILAEMRNF